MAKALIDLVTTGFDHSRDEDEYRKRLLKIVQRKRKGQDVTPAPREEREAPPDLLQALRASVEAARGGGNGRKRSSSRSRPKSRRKSRAKR